MVISTLWPHSFGLCHTNLIRSITSVNASMTSNAFLQDDLSEPLLPENITKLTLSTYYILNLPYLFNLNTRFVP